MEELLNWMEYIEDVRQARKVRHKLKDILVIVLFATLANADDWVEMEMFAKEYPDYLRKYIGLENGIPSHDTLNWVMGLLSPDILQQMYGKWQELLNRNEGEALKRSFVLSGRLCVPIKGKKESRSTLFRHGAGRMVSAWVRRR